MGCTSFYIYIYIYVYVYICDFIYNYTLMWCSQLLSACGDLTICNAGYHLRFRQLEEGGAVDHRSSDGHGVLSAKKGQLRVWVVQGIHHFHSFGRAISIWIHLQLTGSAYSVLVNSSATSCVIHTGSGASSSSYFALAVRVDDPGRSEILSVLTVAPCLQQLVVMVAFRLCRTMSRHRAQFNYLGVRFPNLFLVWQMSKSIPRSFSF